MDALETQLDAIHNAAIKLADAQYDSGRTIAINRAIEVCDEVEAAAQSPQGKAAARACAKAVKGLM